jgi:hypothetical protein
MEDVLEVYHRPFDEKRPQVCLDEASKQLEHVCKGRFNGLLCGFESSEHEFGHSQSNPGLAHLG